MSYLETLPPRSEKEVEDGLKRVRDLLYSKSTSVTDKEAWQLLEAAEREEAQRLNVELFKFGDNQEMLSAIEQMRSRAEVTSRQND